MTRAVHCHGQLFGLALFGLLMAVSASSDPLLAAELMSGEPQPAATSAVAQVPAAVQGTWHAERGAFATFTSSKAVLNLPGVGVVSSMIVAVDTVGDSIALTLGNGWRVVVAPGRALIVRHVGTLDLVADCPILDLGLLGANVPVSLRLTAENNVTWLQLASPSPVSAVAPPAASDAAWLAATAALADPHLATAGRHVVELAHGGASAAAVDAAWAEALREHQLRTWDQLDQAAADPVQLTAIDRRLAEAQAFTAAYQAWR